MIDFSIVGRFYREPLKLLSTKMSTSHPSPTGVLVVGGGLVGLCAGLFLQRHGTPFILVERNTVGSPLPRARGLAVRTMELFRQVGVEADVRAAVESAWEMGVFGGARRGRTMLDSQPLDLPSAGERLTGGDPSPSRFGACPQTRIESVLRRRLEERGGDVRFGCELTGFHDDGDRVTATTRTADGREATITAAHLLGTDGGRSFVRHRIGVGTTGTPPTEHYVNLFFRADLTDRVRGRTFSQCEISNARVQGLFLAMNNTDHWSFHLRYDPAAGSPADLPDAALADLLHAAIGVDDLPVEILYKGNWNTAARVADRYRVGRVFLAGDAVHRMPPWGGLNGNGGIADAHNLAWKLAAVLAGNADPTLLDSYERERRPVALRSAVQAVLRTDFEARFGLRTPTNTEVFADLQDAGALLLRYRYPTADDPSTEPVDRLCGQPGTRFPHAWVLRGTERISLLDLLGGGYVCLAGPQARADWPSAGIIPPFRAAPARYAAEADFTFADETTNWHTLTGLSDRGSVLVRPDGFVAARSDD